MNQSFHHWRPNPLATGAVLVLLIIFAALVAPARAALITWYLENVSLAPSGKITGCFVYDTSNKTINLWNIFLEAPPNYFSSLGYGVSDTVHFAPGAGHSAFITGPTDAPNGAKFEVSTSGSGGTHIEYKTNFEITDPVVNLGIPDIGIPAEIFGDTSVKVLNELGWELAVAKCVIASGGFGPLPPASLLFGTGIIALFADLLRRRRRK